MMAMILHYVENDYVMVIPSMERNLLQRKVFKTQLDAEEYIENPDLSLYKAVDVYISKGYYEDTVYDVYERKEE